MRHVGQNWSPQTYLGVSKFLSRAPLAKMEKHEIEAVLAHELGHFKCNHIKKRIFVLGSVFLVGLAILGWLINEPWF